MSLTPDWCVQKMLLEIGPAHGRDGEVSLGLISKRSQLADVLEGFDGDAVDDEECSHSSTNEQDIVLEIVIQLCSLLASSCSGGDLLGGLFGSGRCLCCSQSNKTKAEENVSRHDIGNRDWKS